MKKVRNGLIYNLRYFCLLAAITLGLMAIVATGGGCGGGGVGGGGAARGRRRQLQFLFP